MSPGAAMTAVAEGGGGGGGDAESASPSEDVLGRATRMQIVFADLVFSVKVPLQKGLLRRQWGDKVLLHGLQGVVAPDRLTAVMGASGAGKTSLLNCLAGHARGDVQIKGTVSVNGSFVSPTQMRRISAYVHQEDVILDTMTVREALYFAAQLRLPSELSRSEKLQRALAVADLLNLERSLDSLVGSVLIKGISGGEKRRLSVGMEMITNPSILFLDEPTTGLDSYTAYKVISLMQKIAQELERTVVATIHQPSSEIFQLFDDLIIVAEGRMLYQGEAAAMVTYFANMGYECPRYTNPADHLFMSILYAEEEVQHSAPALQRSHSTDEMEDIARSKDTELDKQSVPKETKKAQKQVTALLDKWDASPENQALIKTIQSGTMQHGVAKEAVQHLAPFRIQAPLLGKRAMHNIVRNDLILKGKLGQTIFLALIVGLVYLNVSGGLQGVQDREGALFFLAVQGVFGATMAVLSSFGGEKAVFEREYYGRLYSLPAYFISRWVVELPLLIGNPFLAAVMVYWMVGFQNKPEKFGWFALILVLLENAGAAMGIFVACLFHDLSVAISILPMFLLPLMIFSGLFVNYDSIPVYFKWISYISPIKYGFVGLAKNEFYGLQITCKADDNCKPGFSGKDVIAQLGFTDDGSVGQNAGLIFVLMWGFLIMAYIALWLSVRRRA